MNNKCALQSLNKLFTCNINVLTKLNLKEIYYSQKIFKSKVAAASVVIEENEENKVINKIGKINGTIKINNENSTLSDTNTNVINKHSINILKHNKPPISDKTNVVDKEFHIHYPPDSYIGPVTSSSDDLKFLKNHNNFTLIDSQIIKHFKDENKELIWQEMKFDFKKFYQPYMKLSKVRLTSLVVLTSMAGFVIAPGEFVLSKFLLLSGGVFLTSASANAINQFFEVPFDSQMNRTKNRPLVCANISTQSAVYFAMGSAVLGSTILYTTINPLTCCLGVTTLVLYTLIYTPLKRVSIFNTWVGSIVGAIPPVMGWTAVTGSIDAGGLLLGSLLFAWQFPHFCALSWNLKADYSRAGYQMMSTVSPHLCRSTALRYSIIMAPICVLFSHLDITTVSFAYLSLLPNVYMSYLAWRFYRQADAASSRKLFRFSLIYLPIIFSMIMITKNGWGAAAAAAAFVEAVKLPVD